MATKFETVEQYLASLTPTARARVDELRALVRHVLPDAVEVLSYQILGFKLGKRAVVHLSGWAEHASIYPIPAGDDKYQRDIAPYRHGKGTVRFPYDEPLPGELIERHIRFLAAERT